METDKSQSPMRLISVPLDCLREHPDNVRLTPATEEGMRELAASIKAHGLLSPLIVEGDEKGALVIGGGRRLAAMQSLCLDGRMHQAHPVACVLTNGVTPTVEVSLAENSGRERLHAADQAVALAVLRDAGATDRDLSHRFGLSMRTVQRRLRIGRVAPELLERCRNGELGLGVLEAAALVRDHETQVRTVGEALKANPHFLASEVRRRLLGDRIASDHHYARFARMEAYRAAGGTVTHDPSDGRDWLNEPEIVERIALAKLEAAAGDELKRGWPQVEFALDQPDDTWYRSHDYPDEGDEPPEGFEGTLHLSVSARARIMRTAFPDGESSTADDDPQGAPAPYRPPPKLVSDLRTMRCSIERDALSTAPPDLARDLLLWEMLQPEDAMLGLRLRPEMNAADRIAGGVPQCVSSADLALGSRVAALSDWVDHNSPAKSWRELRAMPEEHKQRLLACCVARLLPAPGRVPGKELDIDWRSRWTADASVFQRMTKSQLMCAAAEVIGGQNPLLDEWRKLKKADLVAKLEASVRDGVGHWIPPEAFGERA